MKSRLFARVGFFFVFSFFFSAQAQLAPPTNDNFANRTVLAGSTFSFSGRTYGATEEPNENLVSAYSEASVWWKWVAPSSGIATIQADVFVFGYTELGIFRGAAPFTNYQLSNNLARVDGYSGPFANFRVRAGEEYSFGLFGYRYSENTSSFTLSMAALPAAPLNDNFADRIVLNGASATFAGSTLGASMEPAEDVPSYTTDNDGSRWWSWTAATDGFATLSFSEAPLVSVQTPFVRILRGPDLASLSYVATLSPLSSEAAVFRTRAGETFSFQMRGKASTNIAINLKLDLVNLPPPPANDAFGNRIALEGTNFIFTGNLYGSSYEAGDPFPYASDQSFRSGSIWWTWTAPNDGYVDITAPSTFSGDSVFAIFYGAAGQTLANLGTNIAVLTKAAPATYSVRTRSGDVFVFGISGRAHTNVTHQFSLTTRSAAPANDLFERRFVLPVNGGEFSGSVYDATVESPEYNPGYAGSIWWGWTPLTSGFAAIHLLSESPNAGLFHFVIWRGDSLQQMFVESNLVTYLPMRTGSSIYFPITASQPYAIWFFGPNSTNVLHRFSLSTIPGPGLLSQPEDQYVKAGGATFFHVYTPGIDHTNVTWQFNGAEISGAYGPTLPVFNANPTNVGLYRAIVKNGGQTTLTREASLTVSQPSAMPIRIFRNPNNEYGIYFEMEGEAGMFHELQISTDLTSWQRINNQSLSLWPDGPWLVSMPNPGFRRLQYFSDTSTQDRLFRRYFRAVRLGDFKEACIANLRRIYLATQDYQIRSQLPPGALLPTEQVDRYFSESLRPRCPSGGVYAYDFADTVPTCSLGAIEGHTL